MDKQLPELERGREGGRGRSGEEGAASREEGQGALTTSDYWAREEGRRDHCGVPACGCAHTHTRVCVGVAACQPVPSGCLTELFSLTGRLIAVAEPSLCQTSPRGHGDNRHPTCLRPHRTHTRACFSGLRRQEPSSYFFNVEMINCVNRTLKHH